MAIGRDGWTYWHVSEGLDVRVKVAPSGGRLVLGGVFVEATGRAATRKRVSGVTVRGLALGRLEDVLNTPENFELAVRAIASDRAIDYSPAGCPAGDAYKRSARLPLRSARGHDLAIKDSRRRGGDEEEFLREVARAYSTAVLHTDRPVALLARSNEVSIATLHRWLAQARAHGHLAPSSRGNG
jgi:hypothetical protein